MKNLTIRPASISDASDLARLMEQLGYPTGALEMQARLTGILSQSNYHTLIAERNSHIVGMIGVRLGLYYEKNGVYGQIVALIVEREQRGQHIGSSLVAAGERWLQKGGVQTIIVNSGTHRQAAHRFYEHLGYQATGLRFVKTLAESS
jgi:GNAT superfamily N-acetyltransferase